MVVLKQDKPNRLDILLKRAEEFHGHLGPFLALGVRMSLIGVRELGADEKSSEMHVTAMVKDFPPFSCIIDGIQVATKCTIGNKKLRLKKSSGITAKFEVPDREPINIAVDSTVLNRLEKDLLSENPTPEKLRKMAQLVSSMPEKELFIVKKR